MPQGHQKLPHIFLHVHRWWGRWTKLPGKWSARMHIIFWCSISGVAHLSTFISLNAPLFCDLARMLGSIAPITFIYYSCVHYLYTYATALSPCLLMPFLAVICVNVTPTSSLCMSRINYFSFSQVLVANWVSYVFIQTLYRGAQPLFLHWPLLALCSCFHAP